jgi:hypothetical protein
VRLHGSFATYRLSFVLLGLVIMKSLYVRKAIAVGQYSWKNFAIFSIFWLVWTLPALQTLCTEIGCRYRIRVGWFLDTIATWYPSDILNPEKFLILLLLAYLLLTLYFVAHCLGWILFGVGRLRRGRASGAV